MKPRLLAGLFLAGLCLRVGYGLAHPPVRPDGRLLDSDRYVSMAASFASSLSFADEAGNPTAHREPGYPAALSLFLLLLRREALAVLLANTCFGLAALWVAYRAGRKLFGERAAGLALGLSIVYPPFIFYSAQPYRECWLTLLGAWAVWLLIRAEEDPRPRRFAAAGAAAGLAALSSTPYLGFGLAASCLLWLRRRDRPGEASRRCGAYLAAFLCLYSVWPVRNFLAFGRLVLGTPVAAGDHFYMFQAVPEELGGTPEHYEILERDPVWRAGQGIRDPILRDRFFWKAGLERIRERPLDYLRLAAWRLFWDQWRFWPRPRAYSHSYGLLKLTGALTDGWIIPLFFIGAFWAGLRPPGTAWVYLFIASISVSYALVLTMLRYRVPLMPWIILLASSALDRAWARARSGAKPWVV